MPTATKTKAQGKKPKPPASVTNDPASWPLALTDVCPDYAAAVERHLELSRRRNDVQARHGELARKLAESRGWDRLEADAQARELTSAEPDEAIVERQEMQAELDRLGKELTVVTRAVTLQADIVARAKRGANEKFCAGLYPAHQAAVWELLKAVRQVKMALREVWKISAHLRGADGDFYPPMAHGGLDWRQEGPNNPVTGMLEAAIDRFQQCGYFDDDSTPELREAHQLEMSLPEQQRELSALSERITRLRRKHPDGNAEIANAEQDEHAAQKRWKETHEKIAALKAVALDG